MWSLVLQQSPLKSDLCDHRPPLSFDKLLGPSGSKNRGKNHFLEGTAESPRPRFAGPRFGLTRVLRPSAPKTIHDKPTRPNFPCFGIKNFIRGLAGYPLKDRLPLSAACASTSHTPARSISFVCAYQIKTLFMAVHACPACCVALSASVLWPLRPWAAASFGLRADTQHICVGIDGNLGREPATTINLHGCIFLRVWLFWLRGFGFGKGRGVGKKTYAGAENAEIRNPRKNRKKGTEKNGKFGKGQKPTKSVCFSRVRVLEGHCQRIRADKKNKFCT